MPTSAPAWLVVLSLFLGVGFVVAIGTVLILRQRLRRTARRLVRQEHRLRNLSDMVSHAPGMLARMVLMPDGSRRFEYVSPGSQAVYGLSPRETLRDPDLFVRLRHPDDRERVTRELTQAFQARRGYDIEHRIVLADGTVRWVRAVAHLAGESADSALYHVVVTDVTRQKQIEEALRASEQRLTLALESAGDGVWDWDLETGHEVFSARFMAMYGYGDRERQLTSAEFDALTHPDDRPAMEAARRDHLEGKSPLYVNEHRVRCRDGSWKWVLTRGMVIERTADGRPRRMVGTHMDITARRRAESVIWKQAHLDSLTGLPNRRLFRRRLDELLAETANAASGALALLFLDLDHFKEVNDTLGHECGDELLCEAARRLRQAVGERDVVARLGGDEFAIILPDRKTAGILPSEVEMLLRQLRLPVMLAGEAWHLSASIGCTWQVAGQAGAADALMRQADQALYAAKAAGRDRAHLFTEVLHEAVLRRNRLVNDLRGGLDRGEFFVELQPVVPLDPTLDPIPRAEVLLRWQHPQHGRVSPAEFIPLAEDSGLIQVLGDWVLDAALRLLVHLRHTLHPNTQLSVNLSPAQFKGSLGNIAERCRQQLQDLGLPGQALIFEITEGLLLEPDESLRQQLLMLRDAGIAVALDDFGTGYSSLHYLQQYDIDIVKIDRQFVAGLDVGTRELALCRAVIGMARELGLQVVAEGIEPPKQLALLQEAGCAWGQGFLLGRPMPLDAWVERVKDGCPARQQCPEIDR